MSGQDSTTAALLAEIADLRRQIADLERARDTTLIMPGLEGIFAYFVDNVDAYVFIKDRNGRYLFINRKTEALFTIQRSELASRIYTDFDFFGELEARIIAINDRRVMESGEAMEFEEHLLPGGWENAGPDAGPRTYMALKFPLKDEQGHVIGLCGVSHDMTRLKEAEWALKASEERYRQLSEAALEGILFHEDGIILRFNQTLARMFGFSSAEDLIGRSIFEFIAPESHPLVLEKAQVHSDLPYEIDLVRVDGSRFPVEIITRIAAHHGESARVVVVRDITERRLAEQQRLALEREKERAAVLQYFISDASHDLRTPLTTIKTSLHLLFHLNASDDPAKRERHLAIMRDQTEQLEHLLEHMLHMTRLDAKTAFQFGPVSVNRLIEIIIEAQQEKADRKGHRLDFIPGSEVGMVKADIRHLNRALTNLLDNAIQYTPEGGRVTVFTRQENDIVVIVIQDTGIGIDQHDLPRIFDRFFRADPARNMAAGGVGLGLSITKKIVDVHQGSIEVESGVGQGSRFTVRLPAGA